MNMMNEPRRADRPQGGPEADCSVETLDVYVQRAIDFFERVGAYQLSLPRGVAGKQLLVTGSQNGYWTGVQMFYSAGIPSTYAKEVDAVRAMEINGDSLAGVVIVSATGSRQIVGLAQHALGRGLPVHLIVCQDDSAATRACGGAEGYHEILVPGMELAPVEAPTINTCTYGRMLQGVTQETPAAMRAAVAAVPDADYGRFKAISMFFPNDMSAVGEMVSWKLHGENIGRQIGCQAHYLTNIQHGALVVDAPQEVYIAVGLCPQERAVFDDMLKHIPEERRLYVDLPAEAGPLSTMLAGYALVGRFQPYFPAFQQQIYDYAARSAGWNWLPVVDEPQR